MVSIINYYFIEKKKKNDFVDGSPLSVQPSNIITFVKEGGELVSSLELQNTDPSVIVSFKVNIYQV